MLCNRCGKDFPSAHYLRVPGICSDCFEKLPEEELAAILEEEEKRGEAQAEERQSKRENRPRMPKGLVAWLILGIILNSFFGLMLFGLSSIGSPNYYNPNAGLQFLAGVLSCAAVLCAIAVLRWRMWGVLGFYLCNGIGAFISLVVLRNPISAVGGIVGIVIFWALTSTGKVKPIQYME